MTTNSLSKIQYRITAQVAKMWPGSWLLCNERREDIIRHKQAFYQLYPTRNEISLVLVRSIGSVKGLMASLSPQKDIWVIL